MPPNEAIGTRGQSTTPDDYGNTYENASKEPWVATGQHWLYRIAAVSGGGATAAFAGTVLVGMSGLTGAAGLTGGQIATGFLATAGLGLGVDEVQHGLTGYPSALDSVLSEVTTPGKAAIMKIGIGLATGNAKQIGQALDDLPKALKSLKDAISGVKSTASCIDDAAEGVKDAITSFKDVAGHIRKQGKLPANFITKEQAKELGWVPKKGNLDKVAPGKSIGGDVFENSQGLLPKAPGRTWYEADINYANGFRGSDRLLFSSDGLIYKTSDHYKTFTPFN